MSDKTLDTLFNFLKENRKYNKAFQESFYKAIILPYSSPNEKVISLLHHVVNTQSQPNLNSLASFFQKIQNNYSKLATFNGFVNVIKKDNPSSPYNFSDAFKGLSNQSGWGNKTAALFTKCLYHIHNKKYNVDLKIWDDAPTDITNEKKFYLPVDAVILHIFQKLKIDCPNDFKGINQYLNARYSSKEMEIWDDLWFWGFITQKTVNGERDLEWNESKYWALLHTNKNLKVIEKIKGHANQFINILRH